jgi:hypothetical protein
MRAENVGKEAFQELGAGVINLAAVLEAAKRVDVAHYFVEQDQTPGDPLASLKTSYDYLQKMKA